MTVPRIATTIGRHGLRALVLTVLALSIPEEFALVSPATAQESALTVSQQLARTWTLVDVYFDFLDGRHVQPYGPDVKGRLVFDENGLFSLQITGADRPKFVSRNRREGTAEENAIVVRMTESIFGTYSLNAAAQTLVLHVDRAMFPNWDGGDRDYSFSFNGDQLLTVAPHVPSVDGTYVPHHTWKRSQPPSRN